MKNKHFLAASIMMLMPLTIQAQGHIKRAFNALMTSASAKVESTHKLSKDPETGIKEGQLDVYEFTIPVSHHDLIEDIKQAFDQDKEKAYSLNSASAPNRKQYNYERLAVGGYDEGYMLGDIKGSRYIYALFLDPEDKSNTHRYAYALEWREDSKEIEGKLVITYATTLKYRQGKNSRRTITFNGKKLKIGENDFSFGSGFPFDDSSVFDSDSIPFSRKISSEVWLSEFNTFRKLYEKYLTQPEKTSAGVYATNIYRLCKNAQGLDPVEKEMIVMEIKKLQEKTKDEFIQKLFDMSIERLKK